jgi:hypothetical protein
MKRMIVRASMPKKTRRIFFSMAVLLAGILAPSDSEALIACAPNVVIKNWYCHKTATTPDVAVDTNIHGPGYFCWCYAGSGWTYSGSYYPGSPGDCALNCQAVCGA